MAGRRRKPTNPSEEEALSPAAAGPQVAEAGAPAAASAFPIVGVGASAGGLEALNQMLHALPVDTGMAFVLVQHLSPSRASMLAEILSRTTAMPVAEVEDATRVRPNHVYVIPPDRDMVISRGSLHLLPRQEAQGQHRPIDCFLRSLAADQGHLAIGVILSGTASDGTLGLEEVKAAGGITFAQDDTAQQIGMPRSAIASGCVDLVLPAGEIARELARIAQHPFVAPAPPQARRKKAKGEEPDLGRILETIRRAKGADFRQYKVSTLYRRITRRMVLRKLEGWQDYARFLAKNPAEVEALCQDILINVTSFFRDPELFATLEAKILPKLFKDRSQHEPLRIWTVGCSTGEEAYSLAITCAELAEAGGSPVPIQIFATDLNAAGVEKARAGVYSASIAHDLSPARLRRYFAEVDGGYRVARTIRDMCVFAHHDVLTDPPFSQIDLISCRNLLIYLEPALQHKVVPLLHYALKPAGFLLLGSAETIGSYRELFEVEDSKHRIYAKKPAKPQVALSHAAVLFRDRAVHGAAAGRPQPAASGTEVHKEADRLLLARYAPPGVLVDADLNLELGQTNDDLTNLLASVQLPIVMLGSDLRVRTFTPTAERVFSLVPGDVGRPIGDFKLRLNVPDLERLLAEVIATLSAQEREIQDAHGRWYLLRIRPYTTLANKIEGAVIVLIDVDTLKRAQEYAESIIAAVRESLLVLDGSLRVRSASRSFYQTFDVTPEETEGRLFYDLGNGQWNTPELRHLLEEVLPRDHRFDDFEMSHHFDGIGSRTMSLSARRLTHETGVSPLSLVAIEDVSARKQLEISLRERLEDLAAADRNKNEFLALLAHELRNPLAPVFNALTMLEAPGADRAEVKKASGMMGRQVQHMARLIDDLLDVSRITQGKIHLRRQPVELAALLAGAGELVEHQVESHGQKLSLSLPREPVYIEADPTRMEQVFGNLLNNASKFSPKGGRIAVTVELVRNGPAPEGEVVVRVRDDGIGMEPDTLPRVFDLFMQEDRSLERARGGLGIGLTLVHRLVEMHGGTVEAHSEGLGQGSEFVVRLPALDGKSAAEPRGGREAGPVEEVASSPVLAAPRRILVVDDNVDTAESLAVLLRMRGHRVEVAHEGQGALAIAAALHPEVVLLDIGLPGLDGYEVARRLRHRRPTSDALIVALTGYGQEGDQRRARAAGFDHHLVKPVAPETIYHLLAGLRSETH
jgi:two-component system CheB/CheR fusion protein